MRYKTKSLLSVVGLATSLLIGATTLATANQDLAMMVNVKGDVEEKYNKLVEEKIKSIGFVLTDPHKRVNDGYKKKYGSTSLDVLSFMSIANKTAMSPLLEIDPRLAGFNPFNMLIYKKLDADTTHIGHLVPTAILDMVGVTDEKVRSGYIKMMEPLDKMIKDEFGDNISTIKINKIAENRMMQFEVPFERPEDLDDFIDDFQERFEEAFEENKYIIAGLFNYKESFDNIDRLPSYDAFWVYSLCHFKFSYTVFDGDDGRPDAGLFAPCSMYMYIKKDTNTLVVGMPKLDNWAKTLDIKDENKLKLVQKLDQEIPAIMVSLGAKIVGEESKIAPAKAPEAEAKTTETKEKESKKDEKPEATEGDVIIQIPTVPTPVKPLKVTTLGGNAPVKENLSHYKTRSIALKVSRPPVSATEAKVETDNSNIKVGEVKNSRVSSFLRGKLQSVESVKKALTTAGFTILSANAVDKQGQLTSIVFTNDVLTKLADKKNRGFAASLRVLVNEKDKEIAFTNPLYITRAFMQDEFDEKSVAPVLESIRQAFPNLTNCQDTLKFHLLPKYHFMTAMPYYQDMITVAKGNTTEELVKKAKATNNVVFTQQLSKGRVLIGMNLGKRTAKFIKKIGTRNAGLLPYPIIIEDGEAKIMDPKYYIAIMYPALKMSEFMTISTVPGAIQVDSENLFR